MVKEPFESGDFYENGDVDQNSQKSPRLPWKSNEEAKGPPPLKSGEYCENGKKSQRQF